MLRAGRATAKQPRGPLDRRCSWGSISKLLGELLARDRTAIEPNAVACAFFPLFLRLDLEPQLVLRVAGECAGLAVHRQDAKSIGRVRHRAVVAPQETLDRKVLGLEAL